MASLREYLCAYTEYNQWANEQLLDSIGRLPDEEYYRPVVPKSRAIHELLNHVLVMDKLWLAENRGIELELTSGMQILHEQRDALTADRRATDQELVDLVSGLTDKDLAAILYCDEPEDDLAEWPFMFEAAHVFRHQVHHRGQITVLLQNTSIGAPKLDSLFVPRRVRDAQAAARQ